MNEFDARRIIEALRSGVSSFEVGRYFSSARPKILGEIDEALEAVATDKGSSGRIISAKYGEGKTHLLNMVFNRAHQQNLVVSTVTLSKEAPLSNLPQLYAKIVQGTYLPGSIQPGVSQVLEQLSLGSRSTSALLEYCLTHLETNKLYYVLKSYLGTKDDDEKYLLAADIAGDFMTSAGVRKVYRRVFGETAAFNTNFVKTRHMGDYLSFLSQLFRTQEYEGWVILFDEAELVGRLGRKSRQKAYLNMNRFLAGEKLEHSFALFAFNASFVPDVIEGKHEHDELDKNERLTPAEKATITALLNSIVRATQLAPLNREETAEILSGILACHGRAFGWEPQMESKDFLVATDRYGYLLRTRIRAAIELLDQLYLYGEVGEIQVGKLGHITFEEDEQASLDEFLVP
ncbi:MAG: ATP-binding protein [Coriobacteriales bacterium]|jgi:hypothetical protein|nr:ATP-binding protein [Coriobacteriales bacterium]